MNLRLQTVGDLRRAIADVPDDTPVVLYHSSMPWTAYVQHPTPDDPEFGLTDWSGA